jgi:hypothetical protein
MLTPRRPTQELPNGVAGRGAAGRGSEFDFSVPVAGDHDSGQYDDYGYEDGPNRRERIRRWFARTLVQLSWLGLAAVLAFGSAGMVAATSHSPALGARQELTWGSDQILNVKLDGAVRDLVLLSDDVTRLGAMTRSVLSNLTQVNQLGVTAAQGDGTTALTAIDNRAANLRERLDCGPSTDAKVTQLIKTYSSDAIARYRSVCLALNAVAPLDDDWASLVAGSTETMKVAQDITDHDSLGKAALQLAAAGRYSEALAKLADADKPLSEATTFAANLAIVADLSTLTTWLTRTKGFDDSLRLLWQSMVDSKGRVTPQVTAALKGVNDAKALLPTDNSALQVSLFEMANRLTADGISIETARGQLATAVSVLTGGTVAGP